ncbi:FtsX-like permease family protein [Devosia sp.]|uniref:FtsX-like permease family protein n=1 Tax=Devosia sp. TaxID=1871048 RepID=UPI002AFF3A80|nr:FtsX-like permease family protein [Devosia sp.]
MNPFPVVLSLLNRNRLTLAFFVMLITFAVGLGIAITTQERAVRQGSARAADKFDLVVGSPGSPFDLVLASVFARPAAMGLVDGDTLVRLMAEESVNFAAPIAFGDSANGFPIMGTTAQFVGHLSGELSEGRMFAAPAEAVLGANVPMRLGERLYAAHDGFDLAEMLHEDTVEVVGRMTRTHSAWDNVVVVPVEQVWINHGLPSGHAEGEDRIGPPFLAEALPGVPAVVVKPATVPAAYGLRNAYRTDRTQAIFPAEILVQLYALLGDARAIMSFLALATQILVVAAILSGVVIILQLYRSRFAILRALGATSGYIFLVAWSYVTLLILIGALLGLALGAGASWAVSGYLEAQSGIAIPVTIGWPEIQLILMLIGAGAILALLPAIAIYRQPMVDCLR